ncbi:MAG: cyanophycinase [Acidobacteria bacterium]|nr:cyanophycinase [Acidobacteriota bacterium]
MLHRRLFLGSLTGAVIAQSAKPKIGPSRGSLVVVGGGTMPPALIHRFLDLGGGKNAPFVFIPTAGDADQYDEKWLGTKFLSKAGAEHITILHTRDRKVADSEEFVAPIRKAGGVWFGGGRQWRLVDSYLNTRTHKELWKLLDRGGVIGGSSAGATIQGSYLVRGAREGNTIMMAPGYEQGMGFLRNVAVDQHLLKRNRQDDLVPVIAKHPHLLGIGIDEGTAIIVQGDTAEVMGDSKVAVYDAKYGTGPDGKKYYFLNAGDKLNLASRRRL